MIYCSLIFLNRATTRAIMAIVLALLGISCGIIPKFSQQSPKAEENPPAYNEPFSEDEITEYADILRQLDSRREEAYKELQAIIGSNSEDAINCHQASTIEDLPLEAQKIAIDFCNTSKAIVKERGWSSQEFNRLTLNMRNDPQLKQKIQDEIIRLRTEQGNNNSR